MSMFKGHIIGGLFAYAATVFLFSLGSYSLIQHSAWFIATLAGSLFPDIDIASKGQRLFLKVFVLLLLLFLFLHWYIPIVLLLIFCVLPIVIPHRSLFHDLRFIGIVMLGVSFFLVVLLPAKVNLIISCGLFFLLGVISHLMLDKGFKGTFSR